MKEPLTRVCWKFAAGVIGITAVLGSTAVPAKELDLPGSVNVPFAAVPPPIESLRLTPLPDTGDGGPNARLDVTYLQGQNLPDIVPLTIVGQAYSLKRLHSDALDYSVDIRFDFNAFIAEQSRRKALSTVIQTIPVFEGREQVGTIPFTYIDPAIIHTALHERRSIDVRSEVLWEPPGEIHAGKSLIITDPSVVDDKTRTYDACHPTNKGNPNGVWTFNTLIENMANTAVTGVTGQDLANQWISTYASRVSANARVIVPWKNGAAKVNLLESPMRLLAIVNRMDLRENMAYGGNRGGEVRFVFGVMGRLGNTAPDGPGLIDCRELEFTVILEYGVPHTSCSAVRSYARKWAALSNRSWGSSFNSALQNITQDVTKKGAHPGKPNNSALNQIRSNEITLAHPINAFPPFPADPELRTPWELREYTLSATTHLLTQVGVALTPLRSAQNTPRLKNFINANESSILAEDHTVPAIFEGSAFQALNSLSPHTLPSGAWKAADILNNDARHLFSLNTCNACHGSETDSDFLHVFPRGPDEEAGLSQFMVGNGTLASPDTYTMPDPIISSTIRELGDLVRRQQDLMTLISSDCSSGLVLGDLHGIGLQGIRSH